MSTLPISRSSVPWRAALALLVVVLAAFVPTSAAHADAASERDLVCAANSARKAAGVASLRVSDDLTKVARAHSVEMARTGNLHHNPSLATDVRSYELLGENVGYGPTITRIHDALMGSTGHRRNLLDARFTQVGMGVATSSDGRLWVTQVFRKPSGSVASTAVACSTSTTTTAAVVPVAGDWNGDGHVTPGTFAAGRWRLSNDLTGRTHQVVTYGRAGDLPITGDWNGDGRDSLGVIRDGRWYLTAHTGGSTTHRFDYGRASLGDVPIAGDWNGDGRDTIGIIRDGQWHLRHSLSGGPGQTVFTYGRLTRGDRALIGDWNGDGRDTIGIVRKGEWHLRHSLSGGPGQVVFTYGRVARGDTPIIGDWDGTGRSGVGIVRDGEWHLRNSLSGGPAHHVIRY